MLFLSHGHGHDMIGRRRQGAYFLNKSNGSRCDESLFIFCTGTNVIFFCGFLSLYTRCTAYLQVSTHSCSSVFPPGM